MARKTKKAKRSSTPRSHLHSVDSPPRPPRELLIAGQVLDSLTPDFLRWYEAALGDSAGCMECLAEMRALLGVSLELTGTCSATHVPPAAARAVVDDMAQWGEDEVVHGLLEDWHVYLDFLNETGRWSGPAEDFRQTHDLVVASIEGGPMAGPAIEVPELDEEDEATAFSELALIQRTSALLSWLGTGKDVTSTGALRLKDVGPAAEAVGVRARAVRNAKRPEQPLPGFWSEEPEATEDPTEPLVVRSMHEVPVLNTIWSALRAADLIALGSTRVHPGEAVHRWLHGTPAQRVEAYRQFTTEFLRASVFHESTGPLSFWRPLEEEFATLQVSVLLAGCTGQPVPRERIERTGKSPDDLQDFMTDVLFERVRGRLDQLADMGLVTVDSHYRVPPVVVRCAVAAFGPGEAAAAGDTAVEPAVLRLKIGLRGAKPPIWRRVLVPSTIPLSELHHVIQLLFGWEGYHLHLFSSGDGYSGTRYGPAEPSGPLGMIGDESIDESTVALGALLQHAGDRLTYLYDFGDDWFHDIVLEQVDDLRTAPELPRCTGGRGAAPAEDSGGVWGWASLVAAVNDPAHPEHEDLREWFGLRPGETVDPRAFDVTETDAALAVLR